MEELRQIIKDIAAATAAHYPNYVSSEDIEQDIWVAYLSSGSMQNLVGGEGWEKKLSSTLRKVAYQKAGDEEAAVHGYASEDVYHYSIPVIKTLLEDAFTYEDWQSFGSSGDGQPRARGQVNETGDRMAMLADVKSAWESIPVEQNTLVYDYYKHAHNYERLGTLYNISPAAARSRLERAVKAVQRQLGRKSPADMRKGYEGRRRAYGVAEAQARTESDWNG
jgi:DNA-directed RNA polymerase specialized sigma24 family protein